MNREQIKLAVAEVERITREMSYDEFTELVRRVRDIRGERETPEFQRRINEVKAQAEQARTAFREQHQRTRELIQERRNKLKR